MPRYTRRQAATRDLLKFYQAWRRVASIRQQHRQAALRRVQRPSHARKPSPSLSLSSLSVTSNSAFDPSQSSSSGDSSSDSDSELFFSSDTPGSDTDYTDTESDDGPPPLLPYDHPAALDFDEESGSDLGSGDWSEVRDEVDDGFEADNEAGSGEEEDTLLEGSSRPIGRQVLRALEEQYAHRYQESRSNRPRPPATLPHVLTVLKNERPDLFRTSLRVSPYTFDQIVEALEDDPVFTNNSQNAQLPVDQQVAITLYRFGRNGNGVSVHSVADWAGVAVGTVLLVTRRVMTAILRPGFMRTAVRMPTETEKEAAKVWVEQHSCQAWRDGWSLVDGTLVPLYTRPHWFPESYFDRKSNYSLNIQIVSLPNLRIIDFAYGHTGSAHDATAFEQTRMAQEHDQLLEDTEFIWADSAYPVRYLVVLFDRLSNEPQIASWIVAPYKRPERDEDNNEVFNNHVSMVRIRSEHAIGYLKGRFHSLKGLRINIRDERSHKFATYWVAACIGVHAFAMQCEAEEAENDKDESWDWDFIREGMADDEEAEDTVPQGMNQSAQGRGRLAEGKRRREQLKQALFRAKAQRAARRRDNSP